MRLIEDYIHAFRGPTGVSSACRIRLYLPGAAEPGETLGDAPVVIVSELLDNPGTSVTNAIEQIAAEIMDAHRFAMGRAALRRVLPAKSHRRTRRNLRPGRIRSPRGPRGHARRHLAQGDRLAHLGSPQPPRGRGTRGLPGAGCLNAGGERFTMLRTCARTERRDAWTSTS